MLYEVITLRNLQLGYLGIFQFFDMTRSNTATLLDDDFLAHLDIEGGHVTAQARSLARDAAFVAKEIVVRLFDAMAGRQGRPVTVGGCL